METLNHCPFYFGDVMQTSIPLLLTNHPPGTFLLRNSHSPPYKYALTVQTSRGPTSVRITTLDDRRYKLDSLDKRELIPSFRSVLELVQYYVNRSDNCNQVFIDTKTKELHSKVLLKHPLHRTVPKLMHLARLQINRHKLNVDELPVSLQNYVHSYPYLV